MTSKRYVKHVKINALNLLKKPSWRLASFDLELTSRCNLNCRHCYIRRPASCQKSQNDELITQEISDIGNQAVRLGAIACLITGGEPFLRKDFSEIYQDLKSKGLLLTIFSNGTLVNQSILDTLKKYPPRYVELTVYGATQETYEKVTRTPGSFKAFLRGLELLKNSGIPVILKSMLMRSNRHEHAEIREFCLEQTEESYRFDPFLHLSFDKDEKKNKSIQEERLTPREIVELEKADGERTSCLKKNAKNLIFEKKVGRPEVLFFCGAGKHKCVVGSDGKFRLCESLYAPECMYDLRKGTLKDALDNFVPKVRATVTQSAEYNEKCGACPIINLCMWCPAHAYLETGCMDKHVEYFCEIAQEREKMLSDGKSGSPKNNSV